jgi:threonine dehydrogenase-like Zn-dependent dehydrogenase
MRAVRYYGKEDVRVETAPDPELLNPRDAIIKVTATAICGSDLTGHCHRPVSRASGPGRVAGTRACHRLHAGGRARRVTRLDGWTGPDACIDAVGFEAHGTTLDAWYDRAKFSMYMATDRPHALRQAISACRKGGTVSIPGVYGGWLDKFPLGAAFAKGLTLKMGQTHMHNYLAAARADRAGRDRSLVHHHAPRVAGRRAGDVSHLPREAGCVHQGCHAPA